MEVGWCSSRAAIRIEFGVWGLPETFFLDADGTIVGKVTGGVDFVTVLYLVEQDYETGQALPVTGGQVMLR